TLPDCDHQLPIIAHRGPTHSIVFALFLGTILGAAGLAFGEAIASVSATTMGIFAFGIGVLAILSHLAADCITPMGVRPLWPLSRWHYSANIVRAKNPLANYLFLALGIASVTAALALA
ncbi:metal-dependent hydrolase, partial [Klebsiella pneumoniae]|uniref:metal-dependent hydrolase n=1 Tax=Klebsiella pneumoniae TaxID=573 RepID=UPI001C604E94